jgi:hypothetical protein
MFLLPASHFQPTFGPHRASHREKPPERGPLLVIYSSVSMYVHTPYIHRHQQGKGWKMKACAPCELVGLCAPVSTRSPGFESPSPCPSFPRCRSLCCENSVFSRHLSHCDGTESSGSWSPLCLHIADTAGQSHCSQRTHARVTGSWAWALRKGVFGVSVTASFCMVIRQFPGRDVELETRVRMKVFQIH